MKATLPMLVAILFAACLCACQSGEIDEIPADTNSNFDVDSDVDSDSDVDVDSDADSDSDLDTSTEPWYDDDDDDDDNDEAEPIDLEKLCEEAPALTPWEQDLSAAGNWFGFDLLAEVISRTDGGNVFISPFSMFVVLGMTYNGANGNTETEMDEVLHYGDMEDEEINQGYARLLEIVASQDPDVVLEKADSMWIADGFKDKVGQDFIDVNQTYFDALVSVLDFNDPSAPATINNWISDNTGGKIEDMLSSIPGGTVMYLINALYFNATWTYRFEQTDTYPGEFNTGGGAVETEIMSIWGDFQYFQNELFQAVQLPYGKGVYAMTVLLPRDDKTIDDVQIAMTQENWYELSDSFYLGEVTLELPKFEIKWERVNETDNGMNQTLISMGMEDAFVNADFSGITNGSNLGLVITRVLHNTYIKVDEEGTESAAASLVEIGAPDGDSGGPPAFDMKVNRPFMFAIHDRCNGSILFIGRITDPSQVPQ